MNISLYQTSPTSPDVTSSRKGKYGWCKTNMGDADSYGFCSYSCEFPKDNNGLLEKMMVYKFFAESYEWVMIS